MLALFLAANLMTGGVNMAINTLAIGPWEARGIVGAHRHHPPAGRRVGDCTGEAGAIVPAPQAQWMAGSHLDAPPGGSQRHSA